MFGRLVSTFRSRWHPLWRLRQLSAFRYLQRRFDRTVYTRIPQTDLRVAVKLLRDASWIFAPRELEPEIRAALALVLELVQPAVFWDLGANIGFYSWVVRQHPAVRKVLMFEPDPTNFALIQKTIRKNGVLNCEAMQVALAGRVGEASFLLDHASGATGSLERLAQRENPHMLHHAYALAETITCRTTTVDALIAEGVPPPDLIKIDVEGAEHLVLEGARATLRDHRPTMIIETNKEALVRSLRAHGYAAFRIDPENLLFIATDEASALERLEQAFAKLDRIA